LSRQQNTSFCCLFYCYCVACKPAAKQQKHRTQCVPPALYVEWLVFFNRWLRGQGYFYCSAFSLRFLRLSPRGRGIAPPFKSSHPDKTNWSKKMSKDIFLFFMPWCKFTCKAKA